jgi:hypothetical protein
MPPRVYWVVGQAGLEGVVGRPRHIGTRARLRRAARPDGDPRAVWGAKTWCAPREIRDLQAGRGFWHPTGRDLGSNEQRNAKASQRLSRS